MASVTLLIGGSVPKGLESPMKERKVTRITDIVRKKNSMTDKVQKIREEVEKIARSINPYIPDEEGKNSEYEAGRFAMVTQIMQIIDSLQEEPVSKPIDFEKELYKAFGQVKDFTLGMRIDKWFYDMGKKSREPVNEDLEEAAHHHSVEVLNNTNFMTEGSTLGESLAILQELFKAGAEWQITKLMKDATEVTVHIEAGNYPYIPQMELYDYDKDAPLAKEGDKYKVVLIKEE